MKKIIFGLMLFIGVMFVIGCAGASDAGTYTLKQTVECVSAGIILTTIGGIGIGKQAKNM